MAAPFGDVKMNRSKGNNAIRVHELTWMALLIAFQIVLSKLSIGNNVLRIGFSFIAAGLIGYYFGPYKAAIAGGIADVIQATVFATAGAYFPGFTLSAVLAGAVYGFFLHKRKITLLNVFIPVLLITGIINTFLDTWWITIMYHLNYNAMLLARLPKQAFALVYQTGILYFILKWVSNSRFSKIGR